MEDLSLTDKQAQVIAALRARISELEGTNAQPAPGCEHIQMPLGNASVRVEYANTSEPNERPDAYVSEVMVNGIWVEARDHFLESVIAGWEEALTADLTTDWCSSAAEAAEFNRELSRDLAYDREAA